MRTLLLLIGLAVGAADLRAQSHGSATAHASEPAAPAKAHAAPGKDRTAPRTASSAELDAVLKRISQKIAARSEGAPTRTAQPSGHAAPGAVSAPKSRVTLEWRPSVVWPGNLKPLVGATGADHVTVDWPAVVD